METGMKAQFVAAALFALATGCVASAGPGYVGVQPVTPVVTADVNVGVGTDPAPAPDVVADADAEPPPVDDSDYDDDLYEGDAELLEYEGNPNIRIVYGSDDPVFWSDGFYWRYGSDGTWYRSSIHTGGWAVYGDVPVHIRTIDRPIRFRQYKPATYKPRVRKVGVRPANRHPAHYKSYHKANPKARPRVNNRPDARRAPAHKDNRPDARRAPAHRDNRPDARAQPKPAHKVDNRPDARAQPKPAVKKEEPKKATPAPKKDPPKKYDDKKKDKRK
jgi:hypothetical protein